jgi:SAM-dependent methyltransferase
MVNQPRMLNPVPPTAPPTGFVCPRDHAALTHENETLVCASCQTRYPIIAGVPVLLHEDNSLFRIADYLGDHAYRGASDFGGTLDQTRGARRRYRDIVAWLAGTYIGRRRFSAGDAIAHVHARIERPFIVVIGAGDTKYPASDVLYTDVAFGRNVNCVCDAHDLPFAAGSVDMIIVISVLEHVVDPYRCVAEIQRVLKPDGFVFATTPFLQPVHMGAHDFTRFTYLGHRRLFRYFDDIESGTVGGPGNTLAHVVRQALLSLADGGKPRAVLRLFGLLIGVPLRLADHVLDRRLASYDAAWSVFFFGRKRAVPIPDREILTLFRGGR